MKNQSIRNQISAKSETVFNVIAKNQPFVFAKHLVVYTSNIKTKHKTILKKRKDREIHTGHLYWFTLNQKLHPVLS